MLYFLVEKISRKWRLLYSRAGAGCWRDLQSAGLGNPQEFCVSDIVCDMRKPENKKGAEGLMLVKIGVK